MALLIGSLTRTAVVGLLDAQAGLTVYADGAPDLAQPPYVTVWLSTDLEDTDRLEASTNRVQWRITTHSVGSSAEAALRVAGLVRLALLDTRPAVAGSQSSRVHHTAGRSPQVDESTGVTVADIVDQWTFTAWPTRYQIEGN